MDQNEKRNEGDEGMDDTLGKQEQQPKGTSGTDVDLQPEGDLGTGRERNQPDSERKPGGSRENIGGRDTGTSNE